DRLDVRHLAFLPFARVAVAGTVYWRFEWERHNTQAPTRILTLTAFLTTSPSTLTMLLGTGPRPSYILRRISPPIETGTPKFLEQAT
ncbi:MAG: hypothetical protein ACKPKO_11265, partial [Candidatus Fonsibacter sp.]